MSARSQANSFWLCHECGAQMRPIQRAGTHHCASCDGEFLEILDGEVNPDPFHDLPPPPPVRPTLSPPYHTQRNPPPRFPQLPDLDDEQPGVLSTLLGGLFGGSAPSSVNQPLSPPSQTQGTGTIGGGSGGGGRTFAFNTPGGGRAQIVFGSFDGGMGGGPSGMRGFGPLDMMGGMGGNPHEQGGLDQFFPGFRPPPIGGRTLGGQNTQADPLAGQDPIQIAALINMLVQGTTTGPPGGANLGDYVMSDHGFDHVLEQLMQAAGPQGPIPASDVVIDGLPRFAFTEESLEKSIYKDCPVCKDDFAVGDEAMRVPCAHVFHPDCLQPWLRTNGSCPVCRFSLVPDEENRPTPSQGEPIANNGTFVSGMIPNMLNRLFGQSGAPSAATSPTHEAQSPGFSSILDPMSTAGGQAGSSTPSVAPTSAPISPATASGESHQQEGLSIPTSIPDDYRERHRRREREQQGHPPADDLD